MSDEAGGRGRPPDAARARRALLSYIRHELRTPINAIIGYSELLLEDTEERGESAAGLRSDLRLIHSAGNDLLKLVNDAQSEIDFESFGASFRHALRTMINSIVGYTELLLEDADTHSGDTFAADLQKIQAAGRQLVDLIEGFVNLSRLEAGETAGGLAADAVSAQVHDVLAVVPPLAEEEPAPETRRASLLVVDDNEVNRELLLRQLERQGYEITLAASGLEALALIPARRFDLVLLDMMMPGMSGYEVLQRLKADAALRDVPVVMISALDEVEGVVRCLEIGAEDYLTKPFNPLLLRARIGSSLERKWLRDQEQVYRRQIEEYNRHLESRVEEQVQQIKESFAKSRRALEGTVFALSSAVEMRDPYTAGHQQRVSQLATAIAREMALPASQTEGIRVAGVLHDIGKIAVPAEILSKPGKIREAEFSVVKIHPQVGFDILRSVEFDWPVAEIVLQHQERLNGTGYPGSLAQGAIMLEARILAVADVVEAMATHRPYRPALGIDAALGEIARNRGACYDSAVADACLSLFQTRGFRLD